MEVGKQKPSVMIQVYSSSISSGLNRPSKLKFGEQECQLQEKQSQREGVDQESLSMSTRSDRSTNLFNRVRHKTRCATDINLDQIKGPSGSVRGHRDVVKRSLENIKVVHKSPAYSVGLLFTNRNFVSLNLPSFAPIGASSTGGQTNEARSQVGMNEQLRSECLVSLLEDEQDQCVAYTTSLGVIRRTFDDSRLMRSILDLNLIKYQERDVYLNQEYKRQLRLRCPAYTVPALFVDGHHLGGVKELEMINESGSIGKLLAKFKMSRMQRKTCSCCGNARFIACLSCNGSRRSKVHHFKFNSVALRCIKCDKNDGLVQCPVCFQQADAPSLEDDETDVNNNNSDDTFPVDVRSTGVIVDRL